MTVAQKASNQAVKGAKPIAVSPKSDPRFSFKVFLALLTLSVAATGVTSFEIEGPITQALWFRAFALATLPFYLYLLIQNRNLRSGIKQPLTYATAGFLCASVLASIFGANPARSFWGIYERMDGTYHLANLTLLYLYLVLLAQASQRYFYLLLRLLVSIASLASIYALLVAFGLPPMAPEFYSGRISSIYGNPIFFAGFLVLPMALALFFGCRARTMLSRCIYMAMCALQLAGVCLSATRGALVAWAGGLLLAVILFAVNTVKRSHRYVAIALLAAAILGGLAVKVGASWLPQNESFARLVRFQDKNAKYRLILWRIGWEGFEDRPLLGAGPDNYEFVFIKHFDPKRFEFDSSPNPAYANLIMDKPHNYPVEILATTGLMGFLAYVALFVFTVGAFLRAYLNGLISWAQLVILVCGTAVYHLQNLFAFDTPATSVAFYVYTGLAGGLWTQSRPVYENSALRPRAAFPLWGRVIVGVAAVASLLGVIVTDGITAWTILEIRHGTAVKGLNPRLAKAYFDKADQSRFICDRTELAREYGRFALRLAARRGMDAPFSNATLDSAIAATERAARQVPNDAALLGLLADLYLVKADLNDTPPRPAVEAVIRRAMTLAPNWPDFRVRLARYQLNQQRPDAAAVAARILDAVPLRGPARWIQARVYWRQGQPDLAAQVGMQALRDGYHVELIKELGWLIDYYSRKEDYPRLLELYRKAIDVSSNDSLSWAGLSKTYATLGDTNNAQLASVNWLISYYEERHAYRQLAEVYQKAISSNPSDPKLYESLARVYADMGEKEQAALAAKRAAELDPSVKAQTKLFLRTLE